MTIHPFDMTASDPSRGLLHPHPIVPSVEVDAEAIVVDIEWGCEILDCDHHTDCLLSIHQAHSRHASEQVGICYQHLIEHRDGVVLWLTRPARR